jgi:hypothetical protein
MDRELHPTERGDIVRRLNPAGRIWLRLVARFHEYASDLLARELNLSWITDTLAVGGSFRVADVRRLAALGVGAVIDVREEDADDEAALAQHGIVLLRLPTPDRYGLSGAQLLSGADWALGRLAEGRKVFVHCEHGVGRGPLLGAAVLVASGQTAPQALRLLRAKRWQAAPNDRQLEALLAFEQQLRGTVEPS